MDENHIPALSPKEQEMLDRLQNNQMEDTIKRLSDRRYKVTEEYGNSGQLSKISREFPSKKTLWDWAQLLIVPLLIALLGITFTGAQYLASLQVSERQYQEEVLQTYLDHMTDLLLNHSLLNARWGSAVQEVAEEQTSTALQRLDAGHKAIVVRFLWRAGLLNGNEKTHALPMISLAYSDLEGITLEGISLSYPNLYGALLKDAELHGAILSYADLRRANLMGANLQGAVLASAQLRGAHLEQANLSEVNLNGADLREAYLSGANLQGARVTRQQLDQAESLKGAIMPDGSIHP